MPDADPELSAITAVWLRALTAAAFRSGLSKTDVLDVLRHDLDGYAGNMEMIRVVELAIMAVESLPSADELKKGIGPGRPRPPR
jgi:hypothetical protein